MLFVLSQNNRIFNMRVNFEKRVVEGRQEKHLKPSQHFPKLCENIKCISYYQFDIFQVSKLQFFLMLVDSNFVL